MKLSIAEHDFFLASILLKGLDGILEIVGSILVIIFKPAVVIGLVNYLTQTEISEDPRDLVANYLVHFFQGYTPGLQTFWSSYLFIHGAIKVFLVVALLQRRLWAYPVAIAIFALFIFYQLYRFSLTNSIFLVILSIFDVLVIVLTYWEYQKLAKTGVV